MIEHYCRCSQQQVTKILAYLAQASHSLIPPSTLQPVVLYIASQFLSDRSSPGMWWVIEPLCVYCIVLYSFRFIVKNFLSTEQMTVGLNAITEICRRQPLTMLANAEEETTDLATSTSPHALLTELTSNAFITNKHKGVCAAARGLLGLYREVAPSLLKRSQRGKEAGEKVTGPAMFVCFVLSMRAYSFLY